MEINVNEFVKGLLDSKLNADLSRRRFIQGATGLATLTVLGSPLDAFAADVGGELNYFGWDGENGANVAKDFLAKNKIQMQASFQVSGDEALTRFNTGGRGTLDILTPNKDFQRAILAAGTELFQPLDMSRIPNAAGLFPAFKNASWLIKDGKTYAVPLIWGDEPCVYNPKKWDGVPAKYTDFADPKYKGEIVFMDDPFGNIWLFAKSVGVADPSRLTAAQLQQAVDAMLKVKPNIVTIGASFADMADVMVRGDASIGVCGWAYQTLIAKDKGVELKVASPADDGTYYWQDAYAIAADAPHVDNAYAFINYLLDPKVAAANTNFVTYPNPVPSSKPLVDKAIADDPTIYPPADVDAKLFTFAVLPPEVDRQYTRIWTELKTGR